MNPVGRIIGGAVSGGALTGLTALVLEGGDQDSLLIAIVGGLLISMAISVVIVLTLYFIPRFARRRSLYIIAGAILGAFGFALAANVNISAGDVISNTVQSFIIGGIIGAIVSLSVSSAQLHHPTK